VSPGVAAPPKDSESQRGLVEAEHPDVGGRGRGDELQMADDRRAVPRHQYAAEIAVRAQRHR